MAARLLLRFGTVVLVASAGQACATPTEEEAGTTDDELRRYVDATGERPEVGIVRVDGRCTGTLIGPRTVLTAAHCVGFATTVAAASAPPVGTFSLDYPDGRRRAYGFHRVRADAGILNAKFDLAVLQLDESIGPELATPATIATDWPRKERLTVYGYGRYGTSCKESDPDRPRKRKTTVPPDFPWVKAATCPGDSGGPYFRGTSNEIVATVKGDAFGLEFVGDAVEHRKWILARRDESERGTLAIE